MLRRFRFLWMCSDEFLYRHIARIFHRAVVHTSTTGVLGISVPPPPPAWFRHPRGQIPRNVSPPRPLLEISPPPPPPTPLPPPPHPPPRQSSFLKRLFLYLDIATRSTPGICVGNLFDNRFAESEPILSDIFISWSWLYEIIVLQLQALYFCCLFNIGCFYTRDG